MSLRIADWGHNGISWPERLPGSMAAANVAVVTSIVYYWAENDRIPMDMQTARYTTHT